MVSDICSHSLSSELGFTLNLGSGFHIFLYVFICYFFVCYLPFLRPTATAHEKRPSEPQIQKRKVSRALTKAPEMGIPVPLAFKKPVRSLQLKFTRENAATFAQNWKLIIMQPLVFSTLPVGCGFC